MADQCIVCLEELDIHALLPPSDPDPRADGNVAAGPSSTTALPLLPQQPPIALIKPCGHILHDECLREWSQKANSCPICRHQFNLVDVLDKVGGTVLSEYAVEDKIQVAEFDPGAFMDDEEEEEEPATPCVICQQADQEEVLLLCDSCDAAYHTHCVELDKVPRGRWFCMECIDQQGEQIDIPGQDQHVFEPRTQASERRYRALDRVDNWSHRWNELSRNVHNTIGLDLDFEDVDHGMAEYRRYQHHRSSRLRTRSTNAWRTRQRIAARQGAGDVFRANAQVVVRRAQRPTTPEETPEVQRAWGAFERAKDIGSSAASNRSNRRKRKSPSQTASPAEPAEPERKLKRPRTRRVPETAGPATAPAPAPIAPTEPSPRIRSMPPRPHPVQAHLVNGEPSFLLSLLNEVQMTHDSASSDDDTFRVLRTSAPRAASPVEYSSPASPASPASSYRTSRATSTTPPPQSNKRSRSPLPLTSHVEPFSPSYSPARSPTEEKKDEIQHSDLPSEIRQPRPRKQMSNTITSTAFQDASSVRANMSIQAKEGINQIVKTALAPHWRQATITKQQYADINRAVSRKLYDIIAQQSVIDDEEKHKWKTMATTEVETAVKSMIA